MLEKSVDKVLEYVYELKYLQKSAPFTSSTLSSKTYLKKS